MLAQAAGLDVTGQNIANATTPGYVRRSVILEARSTRGGQQGGVWTAGISRAVSAFAHQRVVTESGLHGAASARSGALATVENILAPAAGQTMGDRANALFGAFSALASNPNDATVRNTVLARAGELAQSISGAAAGLAGTRAELFSTAKSVAGELNERLGKIAKLNDQIAIAQGEGDIAPDLRDQRGQLLREVGERIDVKAIEDGSGKLTLLSSGSVLVDGAGASSVDVGITPSGDLGIALHRPGGSVIDVTSAVTSGTLGGLREARDSDIPALASKLDQTAFDLATAINAVHLAGAGLDGGTGRPFFKQPAVVAGAAYAFAVDSQVAGQPNNLAAAANVAELPGGTSNAIALAQLATASLGAAGSPAQAFGAILGDAGIRKSSADGELSLREATLGQADAVHESVSGVSIQEEMVNLSRYQRAYEASMRVLKTVDDLLNGLMKEL